MTRTTDSLRLSDLSEKTSATVYARSRSLHSESCSLWIWSALFRSQRAGWGLAGVRGDPRAVRIQAAVTPADGDAQVLERQGGRGDLKETAGGLGGGRRMRGIDVDL